MAVKFKQVFKEMLVEHEELFNAFREVHAKYVLEQHKWQDEFNRIGIKVMEVVREYEDKLCRHSEKGQYAKFSMNLSEKFKEELRKEFTMIDFIGVKTELDLAFDSIKKTQL